MGLMSAVKTERALSKTPALVCIGGSRRLSHRFVINARHLPALNLHSPSIMFARASNN